jgi:hypothetical protein
MHVLLREWEGNAVLVKTLLDGFGQFEHHCPIVGSVDPGSNRKIDAAVGQCRDGNKALGIFQNSIIGINQFLDCFADFVDVVALADADC